MSSLRKPVALVINTHSRKAERLFFKSLDLLKASGIDVRDLFPVRDPSRLHEAVTAAIAQGNKTVIIGGGDGTISAMCGHFVGTDVTLGILPLGTANSFIKSLGIPASLEEAVAVIAGGRGVRIDLGTVNGRAFANALSFGYTTLIATHLSHGLKKRLGIFAYAVEGIRQALKARPFTLTVSQRSTHDSFKTYQVIVANGSYYGPSALADTATVNNGKLVILTMKKMRRRSLLLAWLRSTIGGDLRHATSATLSVESASITTNPVQQVSVDGEIVEMRELELAVLPEAVTVLVPASFRPRRRIA